MKVLLIVVVVFIFTSCKKTSDATISYLKFTYNGVDYNYQNENINNINLGIGRGVNGNVQITIGPESLFGGYIYNYSTGCAFFQPTPIAHAINIDPFCILTTQDDLGNTIPIDSQAVYIYRTGLLNAGFSNCVTKNGYDIVTGISYNYDLCDASGTFDLTLVNKTNDIIKLTNGSFKVYGAKLQ